MSDNITAAKLGYGVMLFLFLAAACLGIYAELYINDTQNCTLSGPGASTIQQWGYIPALIVNGITITILLLGVMFLSYRINKLSSKNQFKPNPYTQPAF